MTETKGRFATHAKNYLCRWKKWDSVACEIFTNPNHKSMGNRVKRVEPIFREYGILKCFVENLPDGKRDFEHALKTVDEVSGSNFNNDEALKAVECVRKKFQAFYNKNILVAASKTLWFKFRAPIVMCDKHTITALCLDRHSPDFTYDIFYGKWRKKFKASENEIREECARLPKGCLDDGKEVTSQPWFEERVFDRYLMSLGKGKESSQ